MAEQQREGVLGEGLTGVELCWESHEGHLYSGHWEEVSVTAEVYISKAGRKLLECNI